MACTSPRFSQIAPDPSMLHDFSASSMHTILLKGREKPVRRRMGVSSLRWQLRTDSTELMILEPCLAQSSMMPRACSDRAILKTYEGLVMEAANPSALMLLTLDTSLDSSARVASRIAASSLTLPGEKICSRYMPSTVVDFIFRPSLEQKLPPLLSPPGNRCRLSCPPGARKSGGPRLQGGQEIGEVHQIEAAVPYQSGRKHRG